MHSENMENGPKYSLQGKHRAFGYFAKTEGIMYTGVLKPLILTIRILKYLLQNFPFFPLKTECVCLVGFAHETVANHCDWAGEKQGKYREFENRI